MNYRLAFVGESGVETNSGNGAVGISEHVDRGSVVSAAMTYIDENCSRDCDVYEQNYQLAVAALKRFEFSDDSCCVMRIDYGALVIVS